MANGDNPPAVQATAEAQEVALAPAPPASEAPTAAAAEEVKSAAAATAPVAADKEEASAPAVAAAAPAAPAPAVSAPAAVEGKKEPSKEEPLKEEPKEQPKKETEGGVVVFAGGTDWSMVKKEFRSYRRGPRPFFLFDLLLPLTFSPRLLSRLPKTPPPPPPPPNPPPTPPPPNHQIGRQGGAASKKASAEEQAAEAERQARYPSLPTPVRLAALDNVPVAFVAAGASAVHCLAGAVDGRLFTWGRNEKGQLGHGEEKFFCFVRTWSLDQNRKKRKETHFFPSSSSLSLDLFNSFSSLSK